MVDLTSRLARVDSINPPGNVADVVGLIMMTGATDGRYLRLKRIPTVVYGPDKPTLAYAYDEYVTARDLAGVHYIMRRAVSKYFKLN